MGLVLNDGQTVGIELRRVPQSEYHGLAQGEPVIVTGVVSADRRRVIGTSVQRNDLGEEFQAP